MDMPGFATTDLSGTPPHELFIHDFSTTGGRARPALPAATRRASNGTSATQPRTPAARQLCQHGGSLILWAKAGCEREGVEPTSEALRARIAARLGVPVPGARIPAPVAEIPLQTRGRGAQIVRLCHEILGEKERAVFLARNPTGTSAATPLEELAQRMGTTATRCAQIEASARRKIATAQGVGTVLRTGRESG